MENKKFNPKEIAKLTDPKRLAFQAPDEIWAELELINPKTLIDIGAGTGFFAMPFSEKMEGGGIVYACDSSPVMITWLEENIPKKYQNSIRPLATEENRIKLDSEMADLVYMINLHHELDQPEKMLEEATRLLKKGGTMMVIDWKAEETSFGPPLRIRISAEEIAQQFEAAGLSQIRQHPILPYHSFVTGLK